MRSSLHRATLLNPKATQIDATRAAAALRRQLMRPDLMTYSVMASPPTYSRATATQLTGTTRFVRGSDKGSFTYLGPTQAFSIDVNNFLRCNAAGQLMSTTPPWAVSWRSDSPKFEVNFGANISPKYRLIVDDQLVSATPYNDPGNSNSYADLFDFTSAGGRKMRTYRLECEGSFRFAGVTIAAADTVLRTVSEDPIVGMGDSFIEPTIQESLGSSFYGDGFFSVFGRMLGHRNVVPSGSGGTGYLNPNAGSGRVKFRDRFMNDIVPMNPSRLFFFGGINDKDRESTSPLFYTAAQEYTEAVALYTLAKQQLPYTEIGVFSPWVSSGGVTASGFAFSDALRQAALDCGLKFYDLLGMAPADARATAKLTAASNNTSALSVDAPIPPYSWVRIGSTVPFSGDWGSTPPPAYLTQATTVTGPVGGVYTVNFGGAIPSGVAAGRSITVTGPAWVTGSGGKQTNQTGTGSVDWLIGNDQTHPTALGQIVAGAAAHQSYAQAQPT